MTVMTACRGAALTVLLALPAGVARAAETAAPVHPGAAVYQTHCAACHDQPEAIRTPGLDALRRLNADALRLALSEGVMQQQARGIPRRELFELIDYLAAKEADSGEWLADMMCPAADRGIDLTAPVALPMVGVDAHSTRRLSAVQAGIDSTRLADLELAWAIGFPDTTSLRSSPVIIGDTLFYTPVQTGRLLALDVTRPCVRWVYDAGTQLRTSVSYGEIGPDGRKALVLADRLGRVHAVDPRDGSRIWTVDGRHSDGAAITGAPTLAGDRIIVPVSASGVGHGADPGYECCVEHGAVVALDSASGARLWTYHTMKDAEYTGRVSRVGVKQRGPSGAPIWSTPTVDARRGLVYVTTGQNTSLPATGTSDAVIAIDLVSGQQKWVFQALANDVWIIGCRGPGEASTPNCPSPEESVLKDFDFGAAAVLTRTDGGSEILLAGQKSGDVWALDPDSGALIWNQRLSQGTPLGGVHWGLAVDDRRVFAAINDPAFRVPGFTPRPGISALDIASGEVLWQQPLAADCSPSRRARFERCDERYGFSAAPLVVDRSVIAGTVDGRLYVYDAVTGERVFSYDTLRDFDTVNGVAGNGGAIESHSLFAGAGMVFVGSGYGGFGQPAGNVLLAFRPRDREDDVKESTSGR
ncbi:MAG: PQQ-binding-like beta-propeller repeat protein [Pseudomonadales bacterium]